MAGAQGNEIIKSIFVARNFVPDEYEIYFVKALHTNIEKSIKGNNLVGWYYTHSHQLTIWPNDKAKKKVISLVYE